MFKYRYLELNWKIFFQTVLSKITERVSQQKRLFLSSLSTLSFNKPLFVSVHRIKIGKNVIAFNRFQKKVILFVVFLCPCLFLNKKAIFNNSNLIFIHGKIFGFQDSEILVKIT